MSQTALLRATEDLYMSRGPILFRERDLARAIRSARAAGASRVKVEIDKQTGNIRLDVQMDGKDGESVPADDGADLDNWLKKKNARQAEGT
jgi:hypothetical protein